MYRRKEEQKEMITVCEKYLNVIFDLHQKKELDDLAFVSTCSFTCGFLYATFGDCEKYKLLEASIKFLIDTYQSEKKEQDEFMKNYIKLLIETYQINGGVDNEKE